MLSMKDDYIMTHSNYKERLPDEAHQVKPDWYSRFLSRVVGFNLTYTPVLSTDTRVAHKSGVDILN